MESEDELLCVLEKDYKKEEKTQGMGSAEKERNMVSHI